MSWQKCVTGECYSLAVPLPVVAALRTLHLLIAISTFGLELPADCTVLLWLVVFRSWRQSKRVIAVNADLAVSLDRKGRFQLHERPRSLISHNALWTERCDSGRAGLTTFKSGPDKYESTSQVTRRHGSDTVSPHYTCCRSARVPGCIAMTLVTGYGKPLEILVFYRYHQREFYRRLVRHLAYS